MKKNKRIKRIQCFLIIFTNFLTFDSQKKSFPDVGRNQKKSDPIKPWPKYFLSNS